MNGKSVAYIGTFLIQNNYPFSITNALKRRLLSADHLNDHMPTCTSYSTPYIDVD
jgi:hypothetical protein